MTTVFKFHSKPAKAVPPGPTWAAGRSESLSLLELPPHLEVLYCTTPAQCDAALARVPIHSVWGFDIEWKVTYTKGEKMRPAALLQLSSASLVLLLHLHVCGLTPSLVQLLANPLIRKVGVNVVGDCRKLERDFPHIEVRGAYDLVKMFRIAGEIGDGNGVEDGNGNGDLGTGDGGRNGDGNGSGGRYSQVRSLASLMSTALSLELEKGAVRCSNWERVPLSADQVKYAALDAYAGFVLAEHLMRRCGAPSSTSASIAASTDWEAGTLHLWAELFAHLEIRKHEEWGQSGGRNGNGGCGGSGSAQPTGPGGGTHTTVAGTGADADAGI
ncbi:ribonuclease H-like domain-containing protein [Ochromonadaceae sp. CCMP2298]|nr:ribonuclease H-like domain-containing protein [Ochromonadaceae sp. CCMP2298]